MKPLIIGIAGGTGSGKTTLVDRLREQFGQDISVLTHDSYYAAHHDLSLEERQTLNYDHPASFDTDQMIQDLEDLRQGKTIHCPVYDYTIHDRTDETLTVQPTKVILVEGILIFENKALRDLLDIKIFVDTDADVRILRRILRDVKDRGRSLDSVVEQYLTTVKPMHEQFVEPSKRYADVIVPEGGENLVAIMMIIQRIAYHIEHGDIVSEQ
ncbi:MAG TPA: uridine kinase [Candidatus Evtepia faecigallinarum]|nr:uridine kinase [Candidatus Evtepia faecigallinarum]